MNNQPTFFDFAAEVGLTKHIGSLEATRALIEMCHISKDSYVLDIGCACTCAALNTGNLPGEFARAGSSRRT